MWFTAASRFGHPDNQLGRVFGKRAQAPACNASDRSIQPLSFTVGVGVSEGTMLCVCVCVFTIWRILALLFTSVLTPANFSSSVFFFFFLDGFGTRAFS